jgi:hypothetical protein
LQFHRLQVQLRNDNGEKIGRPYPEQQTNLLHILCYSTSTEQSLNTVLLLLQITTEIQRTANFSTNSKM